MSYGSLWDEGTEDSDERGIYTGKIILKRSHRTQKSQLQQEVPLLDQIQRVMGSRFFFKSQIRQK